MRVHELAKELGLTSKEVMARVHELGGEAKNHMAIVDAPLIEAVRKSFQPKPQEKQKKQAKLEIKKADVKISAEVKASPSALKQKAKDRTAVKVPSKEVPRPSQP